jgi:hypothetical protein
VTGAEKVCAQIDRLKLRQLKISARALPFEGDDV